MSYDKFLIILAYLDFKEKQQTSVLLSKPIRAQSVQKHLGQYWTLLRKDIASS